MRSLDLRASLILASVFILLFFGTLVYILFQSQERAQMRRHADELRSSARLLADRRNFQEAEKLIRQAIAASGTGTLTSGVLFEDLGTIYLAKKDELNAAACFEKAELLYRSLESSTLRRAAAEAAIRCNLQRLVIAKELGPLMPSVRKSVRDLVQLSQTKPTSSPAQLSFFAGQYRQVLRSKVFNSSNSDLYGQARLRSDLQDLDHIQIVSSFAVDELIRGLSDIQAGTIGKSSTTIRQGADELYELAQRNRSNAAEAATTFAAILEGCRGYDALGLHKECFQMAQIGLEVFPRLRFKNELEKLANEQLLCTWLLEGPDTSDAFSFLSKIWAEQKSRCERQQGLALELTKLIELTNAALSKNTKASLPQEFSYNAIPVCLECARLKLGGWQSIFIRCLSQCNSTELRVNSLTELIKGAGKAERFEWSQRLFDEIVALKPTSVIDEKAFENALTTATMNLDPTMPSYPTKLRRLQRATEELHFDTSWIKKFRAEFFQSIGTSKQPSPDRQFLARAYCEEALNESERSNLNWSKWKNFRDKIFVLAGTSQDLEPWRAHVYLRLFNAGWRYYDLARASEIDEAGLRALHSGQHDVANTTTQAAILINYGQYISHYRSQPTLAKNYYQEALDILRKLHKESDPLYAEAQRGLR